MMHRNYIRPTALEQLRIDAMMKGGCVLTMYRRERGLAVPPPAKTECHHIVRNNKRMGHLYTISLNVYYHQGQRRPGSTAAEWRKLYGASLKDSMRVFRASHGVDDLDLWQYLQQLMGMSTELPVSKIYKRPALPAEALISSIGD